MHALPFFSLCFLFLISCKQSTDHRQSLTSELYSEKAREVIEIVARNQGYCNCILEPSANGFLENSAVESPEQDTLIIKRRLMNDLQIDTLEEMNKMLNLSKEIDVFDAFRFTDIKIIPRGGIDTISSREASRSWRAKTNEMCPEGMCYLLKPLFNSTYDLVLVSFYGTSCFPAQHTKLTLMDGQWTHPDLDWK